MLAGYSITLYALLTRRVRSRLARFFYVFLWTETQVKVNENAKEDEANIQQSLTEQAWPIKDLINSQKTLFLAGPTQKIPGGKGESFLSAQAAANQNKGFASYCPRADSAIK